ncbi:MAG: hypothetical protein WA865_10580 [Spirulinaceae cyanobacterium]
MNALRSPEPTPVKKRPLKTRRKKLPQRQPQGAIAAEIAVKVLANAILSVAAITALIKLLPHHFSQQSKFSDVKQEANRTEKRVQALREKLEYTLGTGNEDEVMNLQTGLKDPDKLPVVFND